MIDRIRELLASRPFTPFRVTMTGGSCNDVTDPDLAELTESVLHLYRPDPTQPYGRQRVTMLVLGHVTSVETIEHEYPIIVEARS